MNNINDPVIKQMLETAAYGEAAKMFMQSDLGKHIANRATDEIEEAMNALIDVSPTNVEAISALQRKARMQVAPSRAVRRNPCDFMSCSGSYAGRCRFDSGQGGQSCLSSVEAQIP